MKEDLYLWNLLKLFESSIQILEKNSFQNKTTSNELKKLKFKWLYNQKKQPRQKKLTYKNRECLKTLYLINFEDILDNNLLNRAEVNLLNLLKLNINNYNISILPTEANLLEIYSQTFSINLLYKLHKIRKVK
jgi:hypothetical protein